MDCHPLVSVIVTTRNEEENIGNCLQSVINQSYKKIELIVVDNKSSDNTVKIAKKFTDKVYNIGPERSVQRNFGVKKACGKYILYLDADMILSKGVIEECVRLCENDDCMGSYIPERIIGEGFWIKIRYFYRSLLDATCIDAVRFIRRDKFIQVGGFDTSLTGPEDWDLSRRIKNLGKVGVINAPRYHNEKIFSFKRFLGKKRYYSKGFDKYAEKWGKDDPVVKKQLGSWYRFIGVFIENGKWGKLVRHPLLTLGMYYLMFRVGCTYLMSRIKKDLC